MSKLINFFFDNAPVVGGAGVVRVLIDVAREKKVNIMRAVIQFTISCTLGMSVGYAVFVTKYNEYAVAAAVCSALLGEKLVPLLLNYFTKKANPKL